MALVKRFEDLQAWQAARQLTKRIYAISQGETFRRDYGLTDQSRRAAVSVMNNIVEGFKSGSRGEFVRFLEYASRSGAEVQSCLYVALDQAYCSQQQFDDAYQAVEHVQQLIGAFARYLRTGRRSTLVQVSQRAVTPTLQHSGSPARC